MGSFISRLNRGFSGASKTKINCHTPEIEGLGLDLVVFPDSMADPIETGCGAKELRLKLVVRKGNMRFKQNNELVDLSP